MKKNMNLETDIDFSCVKLIKVGSILIEASEEPSFRTFNIKQQLGLLSPSNVTLIFANKTILVDTGYENEYDTSEKNRKLNRQNLKQALKRYDVKPADIDIVFLTHLHWDHIGNLNMFYKAKWYSSISILLPGFRKRIKAISPGELIADTIRVIATPGHNSMHSSLLVQCHGGTVGICGDAIINHSYFSLGRQWMLNGDFQDVKLGLNSMRLLAKESNVLIPGHGNPFISYEPRWMKEEEYGF